MTSCAAGSLTPRSPRWNTPFASKKGQAITARLIVRRSKTLNRIAPRAKASCSPWRYHAVLTDTPFELVQAEEQHRDHAQVEQVFADLTDGPPGSPAIDGSFPANAAWLACAAIAHNLLRAAGSLASLTCAKARGATLRRDLISIAARITRHGRGEITVQLPGRWHRETEWMNLFEAACGPPAQAA